MYATIDDLTALYGQAALYVADRDGDGAADEGAVERALAAASATVDSYLAARYALPLPPGTDTTVLRDLAIDLAVYRLAQSRDVLTEELRRRHDDARAELARFQEGEQALQLPPAPDGDGEPGAAAEDGPRPVVHAGPERLFSRAGLRDL